MAHPYHYHDPARSPLDQPRPNLFPAGQPSYKTNVNRAKTKKWVEAKPVSYDADDWGEYDEYDEYDRRDSPGPEAVPGPALAHRNSFEAGDERRAFSASATQPASSLAQAPPESVPPPVPRHQSPVAGSRPGGPGSNVASPMTNPPLFSQQFPLPQPPHVQTSDSPGAGSRQSSLGSWAQPMLESVSSLEYQSRRDFSPSAMPHPLNTRAAPAPTSIPESAATRFPPRKSSLSGSSPTTRGPPELVVEASPPSHPSTPSKPLPFIRPADIYKRVDEERQKERQSLDSGRPSIDSLYSPPSVDEGLSRGVAESQSTESLSRNSGNRSLEQPDEGGDPAKAAKPTLETVPERKSEHFPGFPVSHPASASTVSAGVAQPSAMPSHAPLMANPQSLESGFLPHVNRVSTFGDDFWSTSQFGQANTESESVTPALQEQPLPPGRQQQSVLTGPAASHESDPAGFQSVVTQAFTRRDDHSVPPTPLSKSGSLSQSEPGLSRSNTDSTSGISPIMSRVPSAATAAARAREAQNKGRPTPAIAEETDDISVPRSRPTSRPVSATLQGAYAVPRKPSPSHSRDASATSGTSAPAFHGPNGPSPGQSPARSPAIEASKELPEPKVGELSTISPTNVASPSDYTTREADLASAVNKSSGSDPALPEMAKAEQDIQASFLESHKAVSETNSGPGAPRSRSESPTKGRVWDLAGRFGGSNSRRGSTHSLASSHSPIRVPSPPAPEPSQSFRPRLPGQWESHSTEAEEYTLGEAGREAVLGPRPLEPRPTDRADTRSPPKKAEEAGGFGPIPVITEPPSAAITSDKPPLEPMAALAAAGAAIGEAVKASVGLGKDKESSVSGSERPELHPDTVQAGGAERSIGDIYPRPIPLDRTASSAPSSIPPTPPPKDALPIDSPERNLDDVPPPAPLKAGSDSASRKRVSLPPISVPMAPQLSTSSSVEGEEESDRLRKEIVESLSPVKSSDKGETDSAHTQNQVDSGKLSSNHASQRASSILPPEYDRYWDAADENHAEKPPPSAPGPQAPIVATISELPVQSMASQGTSKPPHDKGPGLLGKRFSWEADQSPIELPAFGDEVPKAEPHGQHIVNVDSTFEHTEMPPPVPAHSVPIKSRDSTQIEPPTVLSVVEASTASPTEIRPNRSSFEGLHVVNAEIPQPVELPARLSRDAEQLGYPKLLPQTDPLPISPKDTPAQVPAPAGQTGPSGSKKIVPFREIMALKSSQERIAVFNDTREQFENMNTGLDDWTRRMLVERPEASEPWPAAPRPGTSSTVSSSRHRHTPSISLFTKSSASGTQVSHQQHGDGTAQIPGGQASPGTNPSPHGASQSPKEGRQPHKGKDFLHSAGVLGGRATHGAKGLLAKGRSRFRGGASEKDDDTTLGDSPPRSPSLSPPPSPTPEKQGKVEQPKKLFSIFRRSSVGHDDFISNQQPVLMPTPEKPKEKEKRPSFFYRASSDEPRHLERRHTSLFHHTEPTEVPANAHKQKRHKSLFHRAASDDATKTHARRRSIFRASSSETTHPTAQTPPAMPAPYPSSGSQLLHENETRGPRRKLSHSPFRGSRPSSLVLPRTRGSRPSSITIPKSHEVSSLSNSRAGTDRGTPPIEAGPTLGPAPGPPLSVSQRSSFVPPEEWNTDTVPPLPSKQAGEGDSSGINLGKLGVLPSPTTEGFSMHQKSRPGTEEGKGLTQEEKIIQSIIRHATPPPEEVLGKGLENSSNEQEDGNLETVKENSSTASTNEIFAIKDSEKCPKPDEDAASGKASSQTLPILPFTRSTAINTEDDGDISPLEPRQGDDLFAAAVKQRELKIVPLSNPETTRIGLDVSPVLTPQSAGPYTAKLGEDTLRLQTPGDDSQDQKGSTASLPKLDQALRDVSPVSCEQDEPPITIPSSQSFTAEPLECPPHTPQLADANTISTESKDVELVVFAAPSGREIGNEFGISPAVSWFSGQDEFSKQEANWAMAIPVESVSINVSCAAVMEGSFSRFDHPEDGASTKSDKLHREEANDAADKEDTDSHKYLKEPGLPSGTELSMLPADKQVHPETVESTPPAHERDHTATTAESIPVADGHVQTSPTSETTLSAERQAVQPNENSKPQASISAGLEATEEPSALQSNLPDKSERPQSTVLSEAANWLKPAIVSVESGREGQLGEQPLKERPIDKELEGEEDIADSQKSSQAAPLSLGGLKHAKPASRTEFIMGEQMVEGAITKSLGASQPESLNRKESGLEQTPIPEIAPSNIAEELTRAKLTSEPLPKPPQTDTGRVYSTLDESTVERKVLESPRSATPSAEIPPSGPGVQGHVKAEAVTPNPILEEALKPEGEGKAIEVKTRSSTPDTWERDSAVSDDHPEADQDVDDQVQVAEARVAVMTKAPMLTENVSKEPSPVETPTNENTRQLLAGVQDSHEESSSRFEADIDSQPQSVEERLPESKLVGLETERAPVHDVEREEPKSGLIEPQIERVLVNEDVKEGPRSESIELATERGLVHEDIEREGPKSELIEPETGKESDIAVPEASIYIKDEVKEELKPGLPEVETGKDSTATVLEPRGIKEEVEEPKPELIETGAAKEPAIAVSGSSSDLTEEVKERLKPGLVELRSREDSSVAVPRSSDEIVEEEISSRGSIASETEKQPLAETEEVPSEHRQDLEIAERPIAPTEPVPSTREPTANEVANVDTQPCTADDEITHPKERADEMTQAEPLQKTVGDEELTSDKHGVDISLDETKIDEGPAFTGPSQKSEELEEKEQVDIRKHPERPPPQAPAPNVIEQVGHQVESVPVELVDQEKPQEEKSVQEPPVLSQEIQNQNQQQRLVESVKVPSIDQSTDEAPKPQESLTQIASLHGHSQDQKLEPSRPQASVHDQRGSPSQQSRSSSFQARASEPDSSREHSRSSSRRQVLILTAQPTPLQDHAQPSSFGPRIPPPAKPYYQDHHFEKPQIPPIQTSFPDRHHREPLDVERPMSFVPAPRDASGKPIEQINQSQQYSASGTPSQQTPSSAHRPRYYSQLSASSQGGGPPASGSGISAAAGIAGSTYAQPIGPSQTSSQPPPQPPSVASLRAGVPQPPASQVRYRPLQSAQILSPPAPQPPSQPPYTRPPKIGRALPPSGPQPPLQATYMRPPQARVPQPPANHAEFRPPQSGQALPSAGPQTSSQTPYVRPPHPSVPQLLANQAEFRPPQGGQILPPPVTQPPLQTPHSRSRQTSAPQLPANQAGFRPLQGSQPLSPPAPQPPPKDGQLMLLPQAGVPGGPQGMPSHMAQGGRQNPALPMLQPPQNSQQYVAAPSMVQDPQYQRYQSRQPPPGWPSQQGLSRSGQYHQGQQQHISSPQTTNRRQQTAQHRHLGTVPPVAVAPEPKSKPSLLLNRIPHSNAPGPTVEASANRVSVQDGTPGPLREISSKSNAGGQAIEARVSPTAQDPRQNTGFHALNRPPSEGAASHLSRESTVVQPAASRIDLRMPLTPHPLSPQSQSGAPTAPSTFPQSNLPQRTATVPDKPKKKRFSVGGLFGRSATTTEASKPSKLSKHDTRSQKKKSQPAQPGPQPVAPAVSRNQPVPHIPQQYIQQYQQQGPPQGYPQAAPQQYQQATRPPLPPLNASAYEANRTHIQGPVPQEPAPQEITPQVPQQTQPQVDPPAQRSFEPPSTRQAQSPIAQSPNPEDQDIEPPPGGYYAPRWSHSHGAQGFAAIEQLAASGSKRVSSPGSTTSSHHRHHSASTVGRRVSSPTAAEPQYETPQIPAPYGNGVSYNGPPASTSPHPQQTQWSAVQQRVSEQFPAAYPQGRQNPAESYENRLTPQASNQSQEYRSQSAAASPPVASPLSSASSPSQNQPYRQPRMNSITEQSQQQRPYEIRLPLDNANSRRGIHDPGQVTSGQSPPQGIPQGYREVIPKGPTPPRGSPGVPIPDPSQTPSSFQSGRVSLTPQPPRSVHNSPGPHPLSHSSPSPHHSQHQGYQPPGPEHVGTSQQDLQAPPGRQQRHTPSPLLSDPPAIAHTHSQDTPPPPPPKVPLSPRLPVDANATESGPVGGGGNTQTNNMLEERRMSIGSASSDEQPVMLGVSYPGMEWQPAWVED